MENGGVGIGGEGGEEERGGSKYILAAGSVACVCYGEVGDCPGGGDLEWIGRLGKGGGEG